MGQLLHTIRSTYYAIRSIYYTHSGQATTQYNYGSMANLHKLFGSTIVRSTYYTYFTLVDLRTIPYLTTFMVGYLLTWKGLLHKSSVVKEMRKT